MRSLVSNGIEWTIVYLAPSFEQDRGGSCFLGSQASMKRNIGSFLRYQLFYIK